MTFSEVADALRRTLARHARVFEAREEGPVVHVREVATGKSLAIDVRQVDAYEEREAPGSGGPYLVLRFEDGSQLVLCYAGFGFAPSFVNTGTVAGAPQVVCLRDFHTLLDRLDTIAPERQRRPEAVELIRFLIALLDGARAVGLDIGEEERSLEARLRVVENAE